MTKKEANEATEQPERKETSPYFRISSVVPGEKRPEVEDTAKIKTETEWDAIRAKTYSELGDYISKEQTRRKLERIQKSIDGAAQKRLSLENELKE